MLDLPSMLKYKACCEDNSATASSLGSNAPQPMTSLGDPDSPALTTLNRIRDPRIREVLVFKSSLTVLDCYIDDATCSKSKNACKDLPDGLGEFWSVSQIFWIFSL